MDLKFNTLTVLHTSVVSFDKNNTGGRHCLVAIVQEIVGSKPVNSICFFCRMVSGCGRTESIINDILLCTIDLSSLVW